MSVAAGDLVVPPPARAIVAIRGDEPFVRALPGTHIAAEPVGEYTRRDTPRPKSERRSGEISAPL
jgi:hypothetical protein